MKRRKKRISKWGFYLWVCGFFLCIYVFLFCQLVAIGYSMYKLKQEYEELNIVNKNYKVEYLKLTSPDRLLEMVNSYGIELVFPERWCYLSIEKPEIPERERINGKAEATTE